MGATRVLLHGDGLIQPLGCKAKGLLSMPREVPHTVSACGRCAAVSVSLSTLTLHSDIVCRGHSDPEAWLPPECSQLGRAFGPPVEPRVL